MEEDPLRGSAPVELRQMSFVQRRDIKNLVDKVLDNKIGWSFDQRSVFAEIETKLPSWDMTSKTGAVTMKVVLQIVMRPHLVGKDPQGVRLYHRYIRKEKEPAGGIPEKDGELENDGVLKKLNSEDKFGLKTPWTATVWKDSTWAKKLVDLINTVSNNKFPTMQEEEKKLNEPQTRPFRTSPF